MAIRGLTVRVTEQLSQGFSVSEVSRQAALQTATWAEEQLKAMSPRRTGLLASNWKARVSNNTLIIENPTYYAGFVEYGTRKMAARPMAQIVAPRAREYYMRQLGKRFIRPR